MNLSDWARAEIEHVKKNNTDEYATGVLNSALKAFLSLCDDNHSGLSISIANNFLSRLIKCKPLTPLTGEDDEWADTGVNYEGHNSNVYQNKRCSSVFKEVFNDGRVEYRDIDRFICIDINSEHGHGYHSGYVNSIASEFYPPITFPYGVPTTPIKIYTEDFLVDPVNGDFDTRGIFYGIDSCNNKTDIGVYVKEENRKFVRITHDEYMDRRENKLMHVQHSDLKEVQAKVDKLEKTGPLSDGYHTFDELYYHRMMLFSIICNTHKDIAWKSWKHSDGSMYNDMFIVGVSLPNGDYSYHYNKEHWDNFNVKELETAPEWDGHKPEDIDRLNILVK